MKSPTWSTVVDESQSLGTCRDLASTNPSEPRRRATRDAERRWTITAPVRPERVRAGDGHEARQSPGPRAVALANPSERGPKRENAAEVSRRRSLKTKGPVAFATGPAIVRAEQVSKRRVGVWIS
jgi:hypothetical protein